MQTENKIIVQGLEYTNPTQPKNKDIRKYGLPIKFQKWERHEEYLQWSWNIDPSEGDIWYKNPEEGQLEWYEEEIHRINFGEWVMIKQEPTYINKWLYFFLQWHTLQEGIYPSFRDTSLEFFRFYEIVDDDPFTLGICGIKGRRLGMSSQAASIQLQISLLEENNLHGIVSKTNTDAKELYLMIKFSLENLPSFLMPSMKNIGEKELFFGTPAQRISKNNKLPNVKKGLNNRCGYLATAENSYDGRRLRTIILNEAAKMEECDVSMLFSKISETLVTGASVVGKMLVFSTVNAMDKGGRNFKSIWDDSDQEGKLDSTGQTTSRLKRFFISGYRGVLGYIDEYGSSVVDNPTKEQTEYLKTVVDPTTGKIACPNPHIGAKEYRESRRIALANNPEKLAEEKRKFPFNWKEVFKSANNQCYFNVEELNNQIERLGNRLEDIGRRRDKDELGRRGWFRKLPSGRVSFVDDKDGLWYIHELLTEETSNLFEIKFGKKVPLNCGYGAAGLDAFANANKTAEKGSNACIIVRKRYSAVNSENSGHPVAMFLGRTTTKREFHDQMAWGLQYYGLMLLGERAPTDWVDYMVEENLQGYLIETERKTDGSMVYGVAPQNKQAREEHLTRQMDSSIYDHDKIPFISLVRDRLHFDIDERTDYDICMADGYALMAVESPVKKVVQQKVFSILRKGSVSTY